MHSDKGSQYYDYQKELREYGFICLMSSKGNGYDSSPMESFWGKMKQELLNGKRFSTHKDAMKAVFWCIEVFYKNYRPHGANTYKTPKEFTSAAV